MRLLPFLVMVWLFANPVLGQKKASNNVDVQTFAKLIASGKGTLLDVRTDDEFKAGHIDGAILFDYYQSDFKTKLDKLDKSKPVYVYCAAGGRSAKAMQILVEKGFTEVYNLLGGYQAWAQK